MSRQESRLLVVEKKWVSLRPSTYRGVNRYPPAYQKAYDPDAPVNRAFLWFCEHIGTDGIVRDLIGARNLVKEYSQLSPPIDLEIIEPVLEGAKPILGRELLGWDVSVRGTGFSPVLWGLHLIDSGHRNPELGQLDPLVALAREHFRGLLNQNGLFGNVTDADFCLECFAALDKLRPGLWESYAFELYKVVAVYLVPVED